MAGRRFTAWDDYFISGSIVLKNKFNETDQTALSSKEEFAAQIRLGELVDSPVLGNFDYDHMKAIHKHIFQDVYEWAGQERVAPVTGMTKSGPDVVHFAPGDPEAPTVAYGYYPAPAIADAAATQYRSLGRENFLVGLPKEQFVERLAEYWGELNTIHSFREGNTRSQFVFFSQLAQNAGYRIDVEAFKLGAQLRHEFVAARFYCQATAKSDRLAAVLTKAIHPVEAEVTDFSFTGELDRAVAIRRTTPRRRTPRASGPTQGYQPGPRGYEPPGQGYSPDHGIR